MKSSRHQHDYHFKSVSGNTLTFVCNVPGCSSSKSRRGTEEELRLVDQFPSDSINWHWSHLMKEIRNGDGTWNARGVELAMMVERFKREYPSHVRIVRCDDELHQTSHLVLVEHKTRESYMGTSVLLIPQTGDPVTFFLYPRRRRDLMAALIAIELDAQGPTEAENIAARSRDSKIARLRP